MKSDWKAYMKHTRGKIQPKEAGPTPTIITLSLALLALCVDIVGVAFIAKGPPPGPLGGEALSEAFLLHSCAVSGQSPTSDAKRPLSR